MLFSGAKADCLRLSDADGYAAGSEASASVLVREKLLAVLDALYRG